MPRQVTNVSLSAAPMYKRDGKMTQYDLSFDPKVNAVRCGFYQSKYKGYIISQGDQYYTIDLTTERRSDKISMKFYGTAAYDWIIEDANNISDPIQQLVYGLKIVIPDKSRIFSS
jgi:hypothetical protein